MQEMLGGMETGILNQQLGPVRKPIDELLAKGSGRQNPEQIAELIRVIPIGQRQANWGLFGNIAGALLQGQRIQPSYLARCTGEKTGRQVKSTKVGALPG